MRITLKLVLAILLANSALAALFGYWSVRREADHFRQQTAAEADEVGPVLESFVEQAWQTAGDRGMRESLQRFAAAEHKALLIRWVWFDAEAPADVRPAASPEQLTTVVIQEHKVVETDRPGGISSFCVYWPVAVDARRQGGLELARPLTELESDEHEIILRTAMLIGGMLLISAILAVVLGIHLVGRPLEQLVAKARRIGEGDLQTPVHFGRGGELAELAESLNGMCAKLAESQNRLGRETAARIAALEQLRHADRLRTVGRLAAGIAHELGTPLNVVAGRAGLIGSGRLDAEQITASAVAIKAEADKMTRIIRQLLDFARASTPSKSLVDLRTVVRRTIDMIANMAEKQNVVLEFTPDAEEVLAEVDAGQIEQVLTNLAVNAVQAMPQGGRVRFVIGRRCGPSSLVANSATAVAPPVVWEIEVRDQGVGISEENMQHIFEPFFTTKEVGAGTGLGLSIAYGIVEEHGGRIEVTSRVGEGSCFKVCLPQGAQP